MGDIPSKKLKKLKNLYGYEIAEHNQHHPVKLETPEEQFEALSMMHLERQIQAAVEEYLEDIPDAPEDMEAAYVAVYAALEFFQYHLHSRFKVSPKVQQQAEVFCKAWLESIEE